MIKAKPTAESPETNEQLVRHWSATWYHGVKLFIPPNSITSFGLDLPQEFLKIRLIIKINPTKEDSHNNTISFSLKMCPKYSFLINDFIEKSGNTKN